MRMMILAVVGSLMAAGHARAVTVEFRYSLVYDQNRCCSKYPAREPPWRVIAERDRYERVWHERGPALLERMQQVTGLPFPEQHLIVYVVSCGAEFSDPLTLAAFFPSGAASTDDEFLYDLVHDLLHHYAVLPHYEWIDRRIREKYQGEDVVTLNHVLVASFDVQIHGYAEIVRRYGNQLEYKRALEIAEREGLVVVP